MAASVNGPGAACEAAVSGPVRAALNYLAPRPHGAPAFVTTYAYDPPSGAPRFDGELQSHEVAIHDARPQRSALGLDVQGFMLLDHASAVQDFWDESALREVHYAEAEHVVRELTGARCAKVFDHTLRRRAPGRPPLDGSGGSFAAVREPVGRVHADYTPRSAPARVRAVLGEREAAACLAGRYVIVGLWRPTIATPLLDAPLALCDARTLGPDDLIPNRLIYRERTGETYIGRHSPGQRWHYFAHQRRDEVIVFKHYDSAQPQPGRGPGAVAAVAPHSAFEHPHTGPNTPLRASLELRVLAYF